ncbi:MAG: hypothetical protein H3C25_11035 [Candidatus Brocadia sapporoensis]|jgi:hypothetical protein|nr:hypothetical protein [Candidatus Brocadia sapporoensis]
MQESLDCIASLTMPTFFLRIRSSAGPVFLQSDIPSLVSARSLRLHVRKAYYWLNNARSNLFALLSSGNFVIFNFENILTVPDDYKIQEGTFPLLLAAARTLNPLKNP